MTENPSATRAHEDVDTDGLARTIGEALDAHPSWTIDETTGRLMCSGATCGWVKPPRKSGGRQWRIHQKRALWVAIAAWLEGRAAG